jgi:predicted transposase YbfD/YdcC
VDRDVFPSDGTSPSHDSRYFICSLDPGRVKASDLQRLVRDHWQVENSLHFVKDRWWDEDRHYLKHPTASHPFVELTNAALSILRLLQRDGESLRETAEDFHYSPRKILQILGFHKK